MATSSVNIVAEIRREASRLGFAAVGFSRPSSLAEAMKRYENMLGESRHGEMSYLERQKEERNRPDMIFPGLGTIISAAISYNNRLEYDEKGTKIARYALIDDYHTVVRNKLEKLGEFIRSLLDGPVRTSVSVDSGPVLEKAWAEHSGIGRTGKNTLLIVPSAGSYVFLGELFLDREIGTPKQPLPYPCAGCNACIEHCPTGALVEPGKLDARKCISYLTIELKREFTPEEASSTGNNLFGCDRCQEVCPWNRQANVRADKSFSPKKELCGITPEIILGLGKSEFRKLFHGTPVFRIGLRRLKRNARAVAENLGRSDQKAGN
ncbi:MAG: tRNA epoxyqueuosine(34) reductase QueG [Chlorobiaceae bacterium]|nr:tRNA epoxyqueuosine(34) reductase QueG [Chlorobiaceae bacterium]